MESSKLTKYILVVMFLLCAVLAIYEVCLELNEMEVGTQLIQAWSFCFAVLITMWTAEDSKRFGISRHLGFGLLVLLLWPLVLLYYLPKTRGLEGLVNYIGFWGLYTAPFFLGLTAYSYS